MISWVPIVKETKTAERAWETVTEITRSLQEGAHPSKLLPSKYDESLLYAYMSLARKNTLWLQRATQNLNAEIPLVSAWSPNYLGLFGGLCGLGWTVEHLYQLPELEESGCNPEDEQSEDEDAIAEIDLAVLKSLRVETWTKTYDLIGGLVGMGVYFLERGPSEISAEGLRLIINHLWNLAEFSSSEVAWHTPPSILPDWQRELCPDGYYNLGVAHGIPGIVYLLSEAVAVGIDTDRAQSLLEGSMKWLMAHELPRGSVSRFSGWFAAGASNISRLTWCYGDLGITAVLLLVARRAGRKDWNDYARDLLDHCLARPVESAGIQDAPICHGAAGAAHIFNRMYQLEHDPRCREAALLWIERTLDMRRPGEGVGGILAMTKPEPNGPVVWEADPTFLSGAVGVALVLLAALADVEPNWDRILLLSNSSWNSQQ